MYQTEMGLGLSWSNPSAEEPVTKNVVRYERFLCEKEPEVVDTRSRTSNHQDHQGSSRHSPSSLVLQNQQIPVSEGL